MKGEQFELTFYRNGFFGYGEQGDFRPWGFAHLIPIVVTVAAVVLMSVFRESLRFYQGEEGVRCALVMAMMLCEFGYFWRLSYVGPESHSPKNMMFRLPLQVCEWTILIAIPMLILRSQILFDLVFYLTMSCGLIPFVLPVVISATGPRYFRYYQFWGEHVLPVWAVFYLVFVWGYLPRPIGILLETVLLLLMVPISLRLNNRYEECNYLYLKPENIPPCRRCLRNVRWSNWSFFI